MRVYCIECGASNEGVEDTDETMECPTCGRAVSAGEQRMAATVLTRMLPKKMTVEIEVERRSVQVREDGSVVVVYQMKGVPPDGNGFWQCKHDFAPGTFLHEIQAIPENMRREAGHGLTWHVLDLERWNARALAGDEDSYDE